jgi:hypothetical protein
MKDDEILRAYKTREKMINACKILLGMLHARAEI